MFLKDAKYRLRTACDLIKAIVVRTQHTLRTPKNLLELTIILVRQYEFTDCLSSLHLR